ncbi:MAG: hypothetical protein ACK4N4_11870 [Burkholderiales bacterium]
MRSFRHSGLDIYLGEIQSDLSQVESLVGDAGEMLLDSFTRIVSLVRVQQKMAAEMAAAKEAAEADASPRQKPAFANRDDQITVDQESSLPMVLAQQAVIADQIEQEVGRIVRSLQFQDLTAQLLAHAKGRLAAFESTLERLSAANAHSAPWPDGDQAHKEPEKMMAEVILFPRSKPVVQHGMETGDVELF